MLRDPMATMERAQDKSKLVRIGIGLVRVSSKAQADVQHGSLEQQKHMLKRWAERQGEKSGCEFRIVRIVEEDISGRGESLHKREGLHEVRREIKNGSIDFFVVEKLDRLSRDKIENQIFIETATEHGVEVYEVESGLINLRDRGNRLGFNIKNIMAEEYSLELEEKITKKQREARVNNGKDIATVPMLGLDPHPTKTGMYVVNQAEKAILEDIFTQFWALGGSLTALSEYCRKRGYKTKTRLTLQKIDKDGNIILPRQTGGKEFDPERLRYHLTNPKYRGFGYFRDTWNQFPKLRDENNLVRWEYSHGKVIEQELFDQVQSLLSRNKKHGNRTPGTEHVYWLSGVLEYHDGSKFHGASAKGGQNLYYLNSKSGLRIPKDRIEGVIENRLRQYFETSGTLKSVIDMSLRHGKVGLPLVEEHSRDLRSKLASLEKVIEGFSASLRKAAVENSDRFDEICSLILDEKRKTEAEISELRLELGELEKRKDAICKEHEERALQDYIQLAMRRFYEKPGLQQKHIVQSIIPKVIVHPDDRLELKINPDPTGCHTWEEKVRVRGKWRGVRGSNP